jgi:hypothetical protein
LRGGLLVGLLVGGGRGGGATKIEAG